MFGSGTGRETDRWVEIYGGKEGWRNYTTQEWYETAEKENCTAHKVSAFSPYLSSVIVFVKSISLQLSSHHAYAYHAVMNIWWFIWNVVHGIWQSKFFYENWFTCLKLL